MDPLTRILASVQGLQDSPWLVEVGTSRARTAGMDQRDGAASLMRLLREVPAGRRIPVLLENESWSFYSRRMSDTESKSSTGFQLHTRHLHRYEIECGDHVDPQADTLRGRLPA